MRRSALPLALCLIACAPSMPDDPAEARLEAETWIESAYEALENGDAKAGREWADKARKRRERLKESPVAIAEAHAHIAWARLLEGRSRAAAEQESTVARLCAEVEPGTDDLRSYVLHLMGYVHQQRDDARGARAWWEKALHEFRSFEPVDFGSVTFVANDLADQYRRLGELDRARALQEECVEIARSELGDSPWTGVYLNNLGAMAWDEGQFSRAESLYREALDRAQFSAVPDTARLAAAHLNLGVLLHDQKRWLESSASLDRALEFADAAFEPEDPRRVIFLLERGRVAASQDLFAEASQWWEQGLATLSNQIEPSALTEAWIHQALGESHQRRGDLSAAAAAYEEAIESRGLAYPDSHPDQGESWASLAEVRWAQGRGDEASSAAEKALKLLGSSELHGESRALAHATLARIAARYGTGALARQHFGDALAQVEAMRAVRGGDDLVRARFLGDYVGWVEERMDLSLAEGDAVTALLDTDRMRGRILLDRLAESSTSHSIARPEEREVRARLSAAQRELAQLRGAWSAGDSAILEAMGRRESERDAALREWRDLRARSNAGGVESEFSRESLVELGREAKLRNEAILVFQIGASRSHLFVVASEVDLRVAELRVDPDAAAILGVDPGALTSSSLRRALGVLRLPESNLRRTDSARSVKGLATSRIEASETPSDVDAVDVLSALHRTLLPESLEEFVLSRESLVLLPDGDLHTLPFEMLVLREEGGAPVYWLDEAPTLRYAPSLALLGQLNDSPSDSERDQIVSLCAPRFARLGSSEEWVLPPLPGTARESAALIEAFAPRASRQLAQEEAREGKLREALPRARWLHLATHGLVDEREDALLAALVLADSGETGDALDDGYLNLYEVYDLDLRGCEMVLLSACGTQRGGGMPGEGVFALSRGFLAAGARRTVASLWSIGDDSTAELVEAFARNVADTERRGEEVDHARALRQAKLQLRRQPRWESPLHWAPMVLTGDR